jgi:hypothetical protein
MLRAWLLLLLLLLLLPLLRASGTAACLRSTRCVCFAFVTFDCFELRNSIVCFGSLSLADEEGGGCFADVLI